MRRFTEMYYLVTIVPKSKNGHPAHALNLRQEELERRVLMPYRQGKAITIGGTTIDSRDVGQVRVYEKQDKYEDFDPLAFYEHEGKGKHVTDDFIVGPPGSEPVPKTTEVTRPSANARTVFVVHGRNEAARNALFEFLRAIDLHPLEWPEAVKATGKPMPYIGEILAAAFSKAYAIVVLLTPDDEARLKKSLRSENAPPYEVELSGQARPNVLFEAGMAMSWSQDRTILVELGTLRPFSDIAGLHVIRLDNSSQRRQELADRLRAARCPVNLDGTDWHSAGDFEAAVVGSERTVTQSEPVEELQDATPTNPQLSEDAKRLLIKGAKNDTGTIFKDRPLSGLTINANGKKFVEKGNRRSEARWENALNELIESGLVENQNGKGHVFWITHKGFEYVDHLGDSQ